MNASDHYKESKKALEETEKQNEKKNGLRCWLYNNKHQLMDCHQFKRKPVKERIDFVTKEKICKICFSIIHLLKDCICSIKCRVDGCGKKHHTLLHIESPHQATINFTHIFTSNTCYNGTRCKHNSRFWFRDNFNNVRFSENFKAKGETTTAKHYYCYINISFSYIEVSRILNLFHAPSRSNRNEKCMGRR